MSTGSDVVEQGRARAGAAGVALTLLLTCALVVSVFVALWISLLFVSLGWPRAGLLSAASLVLVAAWAPAAVTAVVAGRHGQSWWTPARLGATAVAVVATTGAVVVMLLAGLGPA